MILGGWRSAVEPGLTFRALENEPFDCGGLGYAHEELACRRDAEGDAVGEDFECGEGSLLRCV